ncbi:MAG: type II toxin-antitoxin system RelE/ParE family toxin [Nitrospirae bacterium]|nr:type II toxin-antitoxin system RelE/ParE family toxin [Nitrospirota bacterium]
MRGNSSHEKDNGEQYRVRLGNFGHSKSLGEGIYELKVDYGPGYRVYFSVIGKTIVLLLLGGDKKSQNKDIAQAKEYRKTFKQR